MARFVMAANRYRCDVSVVSNGRTANGKSILQLSLILVGWVRFLDIKCSGPDAAVCMKELESIVARLFSMNAAKNQGATDEYW